MFVRPPSSPHLASIVPWEAERERAGRGLRTAHQKALADRTVGGSMVGFPRESNPGDDCLEGGKNGGGKKRRGSRPYCAGRALS